MKRLALLLCLVLAGCSTASADRPPHPTPPHQAAAVAHPTKLLVIMEENKSASQAMSGMPYLMSLAKKYGYTANMHAVGDPSEPNYLAIAGGSTFGVSNDDYPSANSGKVGSAATVFDQALAMGKTAHIYNQSMPSNCYLTNNYPYAVKHNPWPYFASSTSRSNCQKYDTSTSGLLTAAQSNALPNVGEVDPNLTYDAHDGTLAQADGYLKQILPSMLNSSDFTNGNLAIVVDFDGASGGHESAAVLCAVLDVNLSGKVVTTSLNQYGLSRWMSRVVGASPLKNAANASDLGVAFGL